MTLIVGANGSMGKRYQAILRFLKKPYILADIEQAPHVKEMAARADGIIIATPTETHFEFIKDLYELKKPILCEKPLSKSITGLHFIKDLVTKENINLTMTMQYRVLDGALRKGETIYNYFRHGNDGLYWDCIQPIGLARGRVTIAEDSPLWICWLNGRRLNLGEMDMAYITFMKKWFERPGDDIERLIDMHHKVMEFQYAKPN